MAGPPIRVWPDLHVLGQKIERQATAGFQDPVSQGHATGPCRSTADERICCLALAAGPQCSRSERRTAGGLRMQRVDRRKRGVAVTSQHRTTALQIGFLFLALCAYGAVKSTNVRITVLDSETHTVVLDNSGVPKNCDAVNFDAYCHNSKTTQVTNTLLVQEGNRTPFRISCNVDTKWSRCAALPKGQTFEAKPEKHGLVVYYADDSGKLRKQLYTL